MTEHLRPTQDERSLIMGINDEGGPQVENAVITAVTRHLIDVHEDSPGERESHLAACARGEITVRDLIITPEGKFLLSSDSKDDSRGIPYTDVYGG